MRNPFWDGPKGSASQPMVFYRTRPSPDGETHTLSVSAWLLVWTSVFGWLAAFLWSLIAVAAALTLIVTTLAGVAF